MSEWRFHVQGEADRHFWALGLGIGWSATERVVQWHVGPWYGEIGVRR